MKPFFNALKKQFFHMAAFSILFLAVSYFLGAHRGCVLHINKSKAFIASRFNGLALYDSV